MTKLPYDPEDIQVRLAKTAQEIEAAQALRYKVFYEEYGATPCSKMLKTKLDIDEYDAIMDHLIVEDMGLPTTDATSPTDGGTPTGRIVGTYRLLRREQAEKHGQFYTSDEYNITPLLENEPDLLELGRSCVLPPYRTRPVLQKLWQGIAHYVADHNIGLMFGCASLHGTDIDKLSHQLAYLYHYHLAPDHLCPRALDERFVDMNLHAKDDLDAKAIFISFPPLIKGYLRLGAYIGNGAVIDHQFNTTDVCIVLPTAIVKEKYVKHYERVTNKIIPTGKQPEEQTKKQVKNPAEKTG